MGRPVCRGLRPLSHEERILVRLCYCFTPYQRLWLYNGALLSPFTTRWGYGGRILDINPRRPHGEGSWWLRARVDRVVFRVQHSTLASICSRREVEFGSIQSIGWSC